jgi:MFS family permease
MSLATAGYFLCREISWIILVVRLLHGAGFGCYITGVFTVVADDAPPTRRAKVIGVFALSGMSAFGFVPMVVEYIIAHLGFQFLFGAALTMLAIGLIISCFIQARGPVKLEFPPIGFISLLFQKDLLIPASALFFFCTGVGALVNFVAVYLASMKISIAYFFVANSTAGAIVRLFLGHFSDVYGRRRVIVPSFVAGGVALFWLGLFHFPIELLLCGLIWGTGIGFAVPAVAACILDEVTPQDRGKGLALFTAAFDLGVMTGSFIHGTVAEHIGYSYMYVVASSVILIAAVVARSLKN